jgi:histidinol-phosphate aminotransferase
MTSSGTGHAQDIGVAENITRLVPYRPGKPIAEVERELGISGIIKLASNENALGPSPKAMEAMQTFAARMHHYPDAASYDLRQALSEFLNVLPESVVVGNGSDDIIHLLGVTFLEPGDEVIQGDPSFVRYAAAAILNNAPCHAVPLTSDWIHDTDAMAERITAKTRLVFIPNPNNPTGTAVGRAALERLLDKLPPRALLVVDEAYYEYATDAPDYPDSLQWIRDGRNVVVLRTFSKAYGLAGLRLGYGVMPPAVAEWLNRTREPFNVNYMAQAAGIAALSDGAHIARTVALNNEGKQEFYRAFAELGLPCTPSWGNFVWVDVKQDCRQVFDGLLRRGVITRTGDIFGAATYLRVTIGTPDENAKFLSALRAVIS